jgi:CO/xanthine dehydrogenase Mo-binding subunit
VDDRTVFWHRRGPGARVVALRRGGFGGKTLWSHHGLAAAAARLAGRPVRLTLTREGVYRIVGGRSLTEQRLAIGAQEDGRFDAIIHRPLGSDDAQRAR